MSVQSDGTQVTTQCAFAEKPIDPPSMRKAIHSAMLVYLIVLPVVASDQENAAARLFFMLVSLRIGRSWKE